MNNLNEFSQPKDAPIAQRRPKIPAPQVDYLYGRGAVTEAIIKDRTITSDKLADELSLGTINNTVLGTPTINGQIADGGTSTNLVLITPTIGTQSSTGGTLSAVTIKNSTVGTPTITGGTITSLVGTSQITGGTLSAAIISGGTITSLIGTSQITGGTSNPDVYQASGTVGATGTVVYVKNLVPGDLGTIKFEKGIAISIV